MTFHLLIATAKGKSLELDRDKGYGVDKRTGWSVAVDGSYVAQFVPLWKALWTAAVATWRHRKEQP